MKGLVTIRGTLTFYSIFAALAMITGSAAAQATNASFTGTYTFVFGSPDNYSIQYNMFGQQVGFCYGSNGPQQFPYGYSCNSSLGQSVITGTLVADGNGNIGLGSGYNFTADPNRYQCSPNNNPAPNCPYQVPAGVPWNSSTAYLAGDEVDYSGRTYQAVKKNTNVPPTGTAVCTRATGKNPPGCTWDQLYQSANGQGNSNGSLSGTYSVQSDGSGTMQVTPSGNNNQPVTFAILVPATSAVGQEVPMAASPQLGNEFRGSGAAERPK